MKRKWRFLGVGLMLAVMICLGACKRRQTVFGEHIGADGETQSRQQVTIYSSMEESQLKAIKEGFERKYPDISLTYYASDSGGIIDKIKVEHQIGKPKADLVWVGNPFDYYRFKQSGILKLYRPAEMEFIDSQYLDTDGYYTGGVAFEVVVGYNTELVKEEELPRCWDDLLDTKWYKKLVMADPLNAGTTKYFVGALLFHNHYGRDYFEQLKENRCELESNTKAVHNQVAEGRYSLGIMLDYITDDMKEKGSPVDYIRFETDRIPVFSPVGLVDGCENEENGKLLYDYILSKEGQRILEDCHLNPVRTDMHSGLGGGDDYGTAIAVDVYRMARKSDGIIEAFDDIFNQ